MGSRQAAFWRIAIYAAALGTAFVVLAATGSFPSADEARDFGEHLGGWVLVAYVLALAGGLFVRRQVATERGAASA